MNHNNFESFLSFLKNIEKGTIIPKPQAKDSFTVQGWKRRRGEDALIYSISNRNYYEEPYLKGITVSELNKAFSVLLEKGEFSRKWFNRELSLCAKEGGCNFTTIGGFFILAGLAKYERSVYRNDGYGSSNVF